MENVALLPGPTHLFFTTGIYYTYLLQKRFNVVLILEKGFNPEPEIIREQIDKFKGNIKIEFIEPRNKYPYAFLLHKTAVHLFNRYQPKFIFMHNTVSPQNIYFFLEARKRKVPVVHYLNALMTEDDEKSWDLYVIRKHNNISKLKNFLKSTIHYKFLPLILTHRPFYPDFDVFQGCNLASSAKKVDPIDFLLVYSKREKEILQKIGHKDGNIVIIQHPLETVGHEVHQIIFEDVDENNDVLVLPSTTADINYLVGQGIDITAIENAWKEIFAELVVKFSGKILIKLHPDLVNDTLWKRIIDAVVNIYKNRIAVLSPLIQPNELILKSNVIISEVSSVLWWAKFIPDKIIISFDLFNAPLGDYFKSEEGIYYFNDIEDFKKADLKPLSSTLRNNVPDLINFLENVNSI